MHQFLFRLGRFLFRLGRGAARRHWVVITIWHVTSVVGPLATADSPQVSPDGQIAYANVQFDVDPSTLDSGYLDQLNAAVTPARDAGLQVEYGAGAPQVGLTETTPAALVPDAAGRPAPPAVPA